MDVGGRAAGAGSGNRTRITSLEGWGFTTKLYPPAQGWPIATAAGLSSSVLIVLGNFGLFGVLRADTDFHPAIGAAAFFVG